MIRKEDELNVKGTEGIPSVSKDKLEGEEAEETCTRVVGDEEVSGRINDVGRPIQIGLK